jgi:rod shape determining protein RodA
MEQRYWREYNWPLLVCVLALLAIGILGVYSATLNAVTAYGSPLRTLFPRHLVNIGIGLAAMMLLTLFDYRLLSSLARPIYVVAVGVLALVLVIGRVSEGAQSWIALGTQTFQPSEFAKLAVIIGLAAYWNRFESQMSNWLVQLGSLILAGLPLLMVFIQPDLGSAVVYGAIWLTMAWMAGLRWYQLFVLLVLTAPVAFIGWTQVLDEYQQERLLTFYWLLTDPSRVDFNAAYNIIQALNAISSGGLYGEGLTLGTSSQGNYVPVQHSDFIFAVIGEELGFVGGLVLLAFQALLLWQALAIAQRAGDTFGRLIAIGIFGMIFAHVLINIGMNLSLLPVTGLPLPLISHGGTFMITVLASIGLLQSIAMRWRKLSF